MDKIIKGRFAPSPTGRMHLGNVFSALIAWLSVRAAHGELVLRIDGTLWRYPAGGTLCDAGRRVRYYISIDPKTLRRADFVAWRTEETRKNIE